MGFPQRSTLQEVSAPLPLLVSGGWGSGSWYNADVSGPVQVELPSSVGGVAVAAWVIRSLVVTFNGTGYGVFLSQQGATGPPFAATDLVWGTVLVNQLVPAVVGGAANEVWANVSGGTGNIGVCVNYDALTEYPTS